MEELSYQQNTLAGATGVELVIALYDGAIRYLYRAAQCAAEEDVRGRRMAVKRVTDILMYLQACLRPDLGAKTSAALGDFYATMFTMALEASSRNSPEEFEEVILCIRNVRDAWTIVARDPDANKVLPRELRTREERAPRSAAPVAAQPFEQVAASRWSA